MQLMQMYNTVQESRTLVKPREFETQRIGRALRSSEDTPPSGLLTKRAFSKQGPWGYFRGPSLYLWGLFDLLPDIFFIFPEQLEIAIA